MFKSFPHYHQLDQMDCGPTCLRMVADHFGRHYSAQSLREKTQISRDGVSMLGIAEAAESIGFKTIGVKVTLKKLIEEVPLPCILHWGQNHFVVLYQISKDPTTVSREFLSRIWGGRKLKSETYNTFQRHLSNEERQKGNNQLNETSTETFFIADPAKNLISYSTEEFEKHWLSTRREGSSEGLALLLEPTSRFFENEEEDGNQVHIDQLIKYLWQYRKLVIQLGMGMLAGSGLSLVFPFLTQSLVDVGIATQNLSFIYLILIAQMVLLCSTSAVDFLRSWILLHISTRLNLTVLSDFLAKLMRLPISFFDVKRFGDIMQRIGDQNRIESFLTGQTLNFLFSIFNLVVFGFVLAYYHITIFIVALAASVIYTFWIVLFFKKRRKLDTKRFEVASRNQSQIIQLIQGMQDIKISGSETSKRWEWEQTQAKLFKWNVKSLSLNQIQQAGSMLINQSKNIFITFLAAKAVVDGQLTLGGMMSVQYILGQFNSPVEQMIGFLQSWQDAKMSLERLNEVHVLPDEEPVNDERRKDWDRNQDINIENLWYTYPGAGNEPVLKDINLSIFHGKTTAIVGTSGSGKTTLLKLLLGFYEPKSGNISLTPSSNKTTIQFSSQSNYLVSPGIGMKYISQKAWRKQCGVVMQDGFIFSDTVARNIAVGDESIDQSRLYRAGNIANIHDFIMSLPLGYHTVIGAEGNGISQGQKQRILIARAVYKDPQLLLFDEATNALDANNEAAIVRNLADFMMGRTVVVVAHRLSTVKNSDQIVVMENGRIVEIGTHNKLIDLKGKYFELISNQLELAAG